MGRTGSPVGGSITAASAYELVLTASWIHGSVVMYPSEIRLSLSSRATPSQLLTPRPVSSTAPAGARPRAPAVLAPPQLERTRQGPQRAPLRRHDPHQPLQRHRRLGHQPHRAERRVDRAELVELVLRDHQYVAPVHRGTRPR